MSNPGKKPWHSSNLPCSFAGMVNFHFPTTVAQSGDSRWIIFKSGVQVAAKLAKFNTKFKCKNIILFPPFPPFITRHAIDSQQARTTRVYRVYKVSCRVCDVSALVSRMCVVCVHTHDVCERDRERYASAFLVVCVILPWCLMCDIRQDLYGRYTHRIRLIIRKIGSQTPWKPFPLPQMRRL